MPEPTSRDVSYDDYLTTSLTNLAEAAAYLDAAIELEDTPALLLALRQVAKAQGMAGVARRADMGEKTLFRALSEPGNPTLDTVTKVLRAMGLRLGVERLHTHV